jgi:hypothetical protein
MALFLWKSQTAPILQFGARHVVVSYVALSHVSPLYHVSPLSHVPPLSHVLSYFCYPKTIFTTPNDLKTPIFDSYEVQFWKFLAL